MSKNSQTKEKVENKEEIKVLYAEDKNKNTFRNKIELENLKGVSYSEDGCTASDGYATSGSYHTGLSSFEEELDETYDYSISENYSEKSEKMLQATDRNKNILQPNTNIQNRESRPLLCPTKCTIL